MRVSKVCNASLLAIIARHKEITYDDLKREHITPTPKGVISSKNVMFDSDLKTLEIEGLIKIEDDSITYIER